MGVMLSSSLLDLSTLFGGGRGGIWIEEGFKLHAHYCLKTQSKISAGCAENKDQNTPSVPTRFFNDCRYGQWRSQGLPGDDQIG